MATIGIIVLGTRGLRGATAALLGSTSANVLHHTHRPVAVVPATRHAAD
jgi:nucleotide-binding universal stress UspA family protein